MEPKTEGQGPDPLVDSVIAHRYKILSRIARGGMATVYLANDEALRREVAIKVLEPPKSTDDPARLLERFRREAESLAQLNHRHIVTIFDYGPTEYGGYFLVMEYVAGASLSDSLKKDEIDPQRAIRLMAQIGRALRYAHRKGIVHRDLKPGNILLGREDEEDVAKLVDFGLVKTEEEALTHHGLILGSVHCMAPEQVRGRQIDQRTDIYAFGCCLYRLLVGQYPFPSKVSTEVLASHIHAEVPSFAEAGAAGRVSPEVEAVVLKCLEKEPDNRYQTVQEVLEALGDATRLPTEDASASIANSGSHELPGDSEASKPSSSSWIWLGAAAAAAVLLLGVGAVGLAFVGGGYLGEGASASVAKAAGGSPESEPTVEPTEPVEAAPEVPADEPLEAPQTAGVEGEQHDEGTAASAPEPEPEPPPKAAPPKRTSSSAKTSTSAPKTTSVAAAPAPEPAPAETTAKPAETTTAQGTASAAPAPEILLQSVDVDATNGIRITLQMSNASVRPLHFLMEGASDEYPMQYVVEFKGGASEIGQKIAVGSPLVDSITMSSKKGKLRIAVNSKQPVKFAFDGSGPTWTITVSAQ